MSGRRNLLGGGAGLLVLAGFAAGAAKAEELDGELLRMCARFHAVHEAQDRQEEADGDDSPTPAYEALQADWWGTLRAITATQARIPEGIAAKAGMVRKALGNLSVFDCPDGIPPDAALLLSLVADILGRGQA